MNLRSFPHYRIIDLPHDCVAKAGLKSISLIQSQRTEESGDGHTLTHAHGEISSGLKTIVAQTAVAALCVDAFAMAAHIGDFQTFITVYRKEV